MIEILTSGVALGVHVPGLLLAERLRERGADVGVSVLERLMSPDTLSTTTRLKWAFHRDFRTAVTGQRLARDVSDAVTERGRAEKLADWRARGVDRFVVFSGFWLPTLEEYVAAQAVRPDIDVCHVDSVLSPSFRKARPTTLTPNHVWLADASRGVLPHSIPVTGEPPIPWADRERRLLAHGGGWGMGTYREHTAELREHGFALDIVAHEHADVTAGDPGVRYFLIDPDWQPWQDDGFPPFGELTAEPRFARGRGHHGSFDLARNAVGMMSKPGGGTLLDSLWSATPVILLEPFGAHERRNAELWERLGFGIPLDRWRERGFDTGLLRDCHEALDAARRSVPDYSELLAGQ